MCSPQSCPVSGGQGHMRPRMVEPWKQGQQRRWLESLCLPCPHPAPAGLEPGTCAQHLAETLPQAESHSRRWPGHWWYTHSTDEELKAQRSDLLTCCRAGRGAQVCWHGSLSTRPAHTKKLLRVWPGDSGRP